MIDTKDDKYIDKFLFRRIQDSKKNEQLNILFKEQQKKYLKLEKLQKF